MRSGYSEGQVDVIRHHLLAEDDVLADDDVQLAFGNTQFSVKEDGTPVAAVTVTRTEARVPLGLLLL